MHIFYTCVFVSKIDLLSENSIAEPVASVTINNYAKCIDIYPQSESDIIASGHANGKLVLSTLGPPEFDYQGLVGKEFCKYLTHIYNILKNILCKCFDKFF